MSKQVVIKVWSESFYLLNSKYCFQTRRVLEASVASQKFFALLSGLMFTFCMNVSERL